MAKFYYFLNPLGQILEVPMQISTNSKKNLEVSFFTKMQQFTL